MPAQQKPKPPRPLARKAKQAPTAQPIPKAYLRLMKKFLLRPIRSDRDLVEAAAVVDELASRPAPLLPEEKHYFDVLCDLIERYEDETVAMPDIGGADMLRFLIAQRGVTQQTVAREASIANSTLSAILTGTRELTRNHIEKLVSYFGVEPAVFLPASK